MSSRDRQQLGAVIEDLVDANHILADQRIVDGFGHVSVRHPGNPARYLLARNVAPEQVTVADVMELDLDGNPIDPARASPIASARSTARSTRRGRV
jgi:ribulose-5-phosphate 4-epimerase/fuculose-1-phosphate aldolase